MVELEASGLAIMYDLPQRVVSRDASRLASKGASLIATATSRAAALLRGACLRWTSRSKAQLRANNIQQSVFHAADVADPRAQMEAIARVEFQPRRLLKECEYRVLLAVEAAARNANAGLRVMAQTSLGEIIRPKKGSGSQQDCDLDQSTASGSIFSSSIDLEPLCSQSNTRAEAITIAVPSCATRSNARLCGRRRLPCWRSLQILADQS